jgi:hypothetical protein
MWASRRRSWPAVSNPVEHEHRMERAAGRFGPAEFNLTAADKALEAFA